MSRGPAVIGRRVETCQCVPGTMRVPRKALIVQERVDES